jgi:transposase
MNQRSTHFTPAQKADIIRRHVIGQERVSDLADQFGAEPSQIDNWVKQVLDQAESAFQDGPGRPRRLEHDTEREIEQLQAKLVDKNEVITELMEELVKLKKASGEP